MTVGQIARICHQTNRAYCQELGDFSQLEWEKAPAWQVDSAMNGVLAIMNDPEGATPKSSHDSWLREKADDGWKYGPVKDPEKREHPCMVPYDQLPKEQRRKDSLFLAIVLALL